MSWDKDADHTQADMDNHANQCNPNNDEYGHSREREICFLATHGILHLLGYDHMDEEEEKEMFALQNKLLDGYNLKRD